MKLWLVLLAVGFVAHPASGVSSEWKTNAHGKVRVVVPYQVAPKSGTIYLGIHFIPKPGWMLYWKQSGDAGYPPTFGFKGSKGLQSPETLWPKPRIFDLPGNIREYGYDEEVVYPIRAIARTEGTALQIVADVNYLTCQESCVPYRYTIKVDVPQADTAQPDSEIDQLLKKYISRVPSESDEQVIASLKPEANASPTVLWLMLLAFLGGLILNVMPCVLPVLSIKLFGLLEHGGRQRGVIVRDSIASAAGIVFSFVIGGALAVVAKQAGGAVGWGVQFQNPSFVAALGIVITLFALNLWGVYEINLPPALAQLGAARGEKEGVLSYFVSGMLATLLATPCSAPFLGTAVGFGLSQPPTIIILVFLFAGIGMALPYLLLAVFPGSLAWLPKPGAWMHQVRVLLGFLLATTIVWLGYVLSRQVNALGVAFFYLGLLGLGAGAWFKGQAGVRPWVNRIAWLLIGLVALASLAGVRANQQSGSADIATGSLTWQSFDQSKISTLMAEGKSVWVDITADWCFTCKYNERFVLDTPEIREAFMTNGIVLMRGDWTNRDSVIGDYLKSFNRQGIPFNAIYRPGKKPIVLPELLTKSRVLEALRQ
jgi:thiol:disulfide interchange protein